MSVYPGTRPTEQAPAAPRRRLLPRALVVFVLLAALVNMLMVEASIPSLYIPDSAPRGVRPYDAVPAVVHVGGPIIDLTGPEPATYRAPPKTIALTFDDGPDPAWTPQILDVLRHHQAHATFFVLGSRVVRNTDLTRRITDEGHEIGVHTFTHPRLTALPAWRQGFELSTTRSVVAYATGRASTLYRPPYSSTNDALDNTDVAALRDTGLDGLLTVLSDLDSEDWRRPGADTIIRRATPRGDAGAVVLMHDAGGDRSQTIAALDRLIPQLQQRGYRFVTVSETLRGRGPVTDPPATTAQTLRGGAAVAMVGIADVTLRLLWLLLLIAGVLFAARTLMVLILAVQHAHRRRTPSWSWGPPVTDPVSIIVPAFNEATTIAPAVRSLALSAHPGVEVIVIDDASTDGTAQVVEDQKLGNVRVISVPSGGKASALNTGTGFAHHDLIVMVDADTVVEPDAIHRLVQPFADPRVGAVSGNVKVGNRHGLLGRWQHIEYVIGFNLDRRLYDTLGCIPTVPGALGAFRRTALHDAGGLHTDTLAEDTDLTIAVHRAGWRVVFEDAARAWTEAPTGLRQLWRQRYRWSFGTMQALWKHRRAVLTGKPPGLPFVVFFTVLLPLLAPLIDIMTVYGAVFLDRPEAVWGWLAMMAAQTVTAVVAFRLDHEPATPLWTLPLQQVFYRQLMYLVLIHSALTAFSGQRLHWQKLRRTGEVAVPMK
ncbi:bifunctional polysaccharide deacetylase/glycosyltransferase family 2 protein [Actinoplanes sp. NPDC023714]|uniref:bifunctional polysaccharide deacetylase/glycosyltransferase family 2 protein n=1 Tax=Actinoplanes sp. NPDC023714 TaxID=3154322 RepID=UPI00340C1724